MNCKLKPEGEAILKLSRGFTKSEIFDIRRSIKLAVLVMQEMEKIVQE